MLRDDSEVAERVNRIFNMRTHRRIDSRPQGVAERCLTHVNRSSSSHKARNFRCGVIETLLRFVEQAICSDRLDRPQQNAKKSFHLCVTFLSFFCFFIEVNVNNRIVARRRYIRTITLSSLSYISLFFARDNPGGPGTFGRRSFSRFHGGLFLHATLLQSIHISKYTSTMYGESAQMAILFPRANNV